MELRKILAYRGLILAIAILCLWIISGYFYLSHSLASLGMAGIFVGILMRTWLHTGLFIVAHDAIHGNLLPHYLWLNHQLGQGFLFLYGCLPYQFCRRNHHLHHQFPAQIKDPDFHDGLHSHPYFWYLRFMGRYFSYGYLCKFSLVIVSLSIYSHTQFNIAYLNIFSFLLVPLCLSSLQLFFFGTYFPHGHKPFPVLDRRQYPLLAYAWSLISCYHFGVYHREHHAFPHQPWFLLPHAV